MLLAYKRTRSDPPVSYCLLKSKRASECSINGEAMCQYLKPLWGEKNPNLCISLQSDRTDLKPQFLSLELSYLIKTLILAGAAAH